MSAPALDHLTATAAVKSSHEEEVRTVNMEIIVGGSFLAVS
jgi:hypothetical protein